MATPYSPKRSERQRRSCAQRRAETIDEALRHALDIMTAEGVGALSMSEVARRLGMRPPSLYKYFDSVHAMYDALFERASREHHAEAVGAADERTGAIDRLVAAAEGTVHWSLAHPALAQLIFWRPVPGYTPSEQAYRPAIESIARLRHEIETAIAAGELRADADAESIAARYTVVVAGVVSQQLANQPGVGAAEGRYSRFTAPLVRTLLAAEVPEGANHAATARP